MPFIFAVPQLAGNGETVLSVTGLGGGVAAGRRGAVENVHMVLLVIDAFPQYLDDATVAELALQPVQELPASGVVGVQGQGGGHVGLRGNEECRELLQVHTVAAVVVGRVAGHPAGGIRGRPLADLPGVRSVAAAIGEQTDDAIFQAALGGIGGASVVAGIPNGMPSGLRIKFDVGRSGEHAAARIGELDNLRNVGRVYVRVGHCREDLQLSLLVRSQISIPHRLPSRAQRLGAL